MRDAQDDAKEQITGILFFGEAVKARGSIEFVDE